MSVHLLRASQSNINVECTDGTDGKTDYETLPQLANAVSTDVFVLCQAVFIFPLCKICFLYNTGCTQQVDSLHD